jgi:hypothetical protein
MTGKQLQQSLDKSTEAEHAGETTAKVAGESVSDDKQAKRYEPKFLSFSSFNTQVSLDGSSPLGQLMAHVNGKKPGEQIGQRIAEFALEDKESGKVFTARGERSLHELSSPCPSEVRGQQDWNAHRDMVCIDNEVKEIFAELVKSEHHQIDGILQDIAIIGTQSGGLQRAPLWGCSEQAEFTRQKLEDFLEKSELSDNWNKPETKSLFVHNWVEMDSKDGKYRIKIDPFLFKVEFVPLG